MQRPLTSKDLPITVLKVGGARLNSTADLDRLADQVAQLLRRGQQPIVVHGGGPEISELHERLEIPFEKVEGLRATSDEGMAATIMVLCGAVRTRIVERFVEKGITTLGVSGVDLGILRAEFADLDKLGRVGGPPTVDREAVMKLLEHNATLVISPVSIGPDGRAVNVNADDAAHAIATSLRANALNFVSDIPGVRTKNGAIASRLEPTHIRAMIANGVVSGGMVPKLRAAVAAVRAGVSRVRIGNLDTMAAERATVITSERRNS